MTPSQSFGNGYKFALILVGILMLGGVPAVQAAGPTAPYAGPEAALGQTLNGSIDVQRGSVNGEVTLGRGNVGLNAQLADTGPQGRFMLEVPGQFALAVSAADGSIAGSTICGVVGSQELTASAGRGDGLHLDFHNADNDPSACALPGTITSTVMLAPSLTFAQIVPRSDGTTALDSILDAVQRLVVLSIIGALLFVFAPGLSTPLAATALTAPWSRLGLGLSLLIAVPVIGVSIFIAGLTVGLWWFGLLVLMFFACLLAASMAVTGLVVGAWLLARYRARSIPTVAGFAAGLLVLSVLSLLPVLGPVVNLVALAYGAGALMLLPRAVKPAAVAAAELVRPPVADQVEPLPVVTPAAAVAVADALTNGDVNGPRAAA